MTKLREYGIVTQARRGQGYDWAANMAGKFSGVRTRIQTEIPEAYNVHCYAHCLNLAVVKSCLLPIVRNTIDQYCKRCFICLSLFFEKNR